MANFELRLDGRIVAKVEIDTGLLLRLIAGGGETPIAAVAEPEAPHNSVELTPEQARDLIDRAGPAADYLKRFVEESGAITWGETKQTFEVKSWDEFETGPLKKLEKAVQKVTGDKDQRLIWRVEHEWIGLEKGEDEVCRLHIDGPALAALKAAFD